VGKLKLFQGLGAIVNCRPGEGWPAVLMFTHSLFLGFAWIYYKTASDALFLSQYGAQALPYVYLGSTVITGGFAYLYTKLDGRVRQTVLLVGLIGFYLLLLVVARLALLLPDNGPVVVAVRVIRPLLILVVDLEFWALAGRLFDLRQGKRLFGLISAGNVLATILGGLSVPLLGLLLPITDLLDLAVVALGLCLALLVYILRANFAALEHTAASEVKSEAESHLSLGTLLRNRYLSLILALYACFIFASLFLDFGFYGEVEGRYKEKEKQLADFLGAFSAVGATVGLFAQAFLSGWLLPRFGLFGGLLGLPLALVVGCGLVMVLGLTGVGGLGAVFWVIVATKLSETVLTSAVQYPAVRVLYQPLPSGQRVAFQAVVEGMLDAAIVGLAGGLMVVLTRSTSFGGWKVAFVLVPLAVLWITVSLGLNRAYARVLETCLAKRRLDPGALSLGDASSRQVLDRWLQSTNAVEVLHALSVIPAEEKEMREILVRLLDHPSPDVRQEALARIEARPFAAARACVQQLIRQESSPTVQGMALRVLVALNDGDAVEWTQSFLDDERPELRQGALVGLLRHGGPEGVMAAGTCFLELTRSEKAADRAMAARVLGDVAIHSFSRPLVHLLRDPDLTVRRVALKAAIRVASPDLGPAVLASLGVPSLRSLAVEALAAPGRASLPFLKMAFAESQRTPAERVLLLRVCQLSCVVEAIPFLEEQLEVPDGEIRRQALYGLIQLGYDTAQAQEAARARTMQACGRATLLLAATDDLQRAGLIEKSPLLRALEIEVRRTREEIFLLLCLAYPAGGVASAWPHLESGATAKRVLALESLDQLLPRRLKEVVFALVDELPQATRLQRLASAFPQETLSLQERLRMLLEHTDWLSLWTRACVLYEIGLRGRTELSEEARRWRSHSNRLIQETASWACAQIESGWKGGSACS
jgi:ATP/ADP translocase/HEAT repeat protein